MERKSQSRSRPMSMPPLQKMQGLPEQGVAPVKKPFLRADTAIILNKKPLLRTNTIAAAPSKKLFSRANTVYGLPLPLQPKTNNISFAGNVMAELVECGVCMDRLNSPKMLPCQHTFCHTCLDTLLKGTEITCPTCRTVAQVTGGVATLPSNLYLDSLLAAMVARGGGNVANVATPNRCVQCQTVGNVTLCQHCQQMLCPVCWPDHVAELRRQMLVLQEQLQGASDKLSHKTQDFTDKCAKLHDYIDEAVAAKIASIHELKKTLNKEAKEILTTGEESANELKEKLVHAGENISVLSFDNVTGDTQKVKMFLDLHGLTASLLAEVSNWGSYRPTFDRDSFKIHYQEEEYDGDAAQEEEETEEERARQLENMTSPDGISLQYRSRTATPRLSMMRSGLQRPAGITMSPWNPSLLFVAGTDNSQVLVVDRTKGRVVTRLTSPAMICPQGVACSANRIYVTDKWSHQIHVFASDGTYLKALGKKGDGVGQMRSPEGIAAGINPSITASVEEDDNVLLYLCDAGNDRLQVLRAHDGSLVRILGSVGRPVDGKMTTELSAPTGVAVNEHKVVVADCGNNRIKVYSLNGEKMLEFGSHGCGRGQFRSPESVAIDRFGFILVGDAGNSRIQIFRPNGNLVRTLGGRNAKTCNLGWISGITVSDSMEIISGDTKNHGLHFF